MERKRKWIENGTKQKPKRHGRVQAMSLSCIWTVKMLSQHKSGLRRKEKKTF